MTSTEDRDIVYFFFKDHESSDLMLAILNTVPKEKELSEEDKLYGRTSRKYEVPVTHFFRIKDKEIISAIKYFDFKKIDGSALIQNP